MSGNGSLTATQVLIVFVLVAFFLLVIIWHIILLPLLVTFLHINILFVPLEAAVVHPFLLLVPLLVDLQPVGELWRLRPCLGLPHIW